MSGEDDEEGEYSTEQEDEEGEIEQLAQTTEKSKNGKGQATTSDSSPQVTMGGGGAKKRARGQCE